MRLQIEVLDGPEKGKKIALRKGLLLGRSAESLSFADQAMGSQHGYLDFDLKKSWIFECLLPNKVRVGSAEQERITLMPGLVFHLGQTAFKVIEKVNRVYETWDEGLIAWLKENPGHQKPNDFFFFLSPISLAFIQGPQYEQFITLSYGPRHMGHSSLDIELIDPSIPKSVAQFFQVGERCYIENLCGNLATINSNPFDQHPIQDGDRLKINSTIIEMSTIK